MWLTISTREGWNCNPLTPARAFCRGKLLGSKRDRVRLPGMMNASIRRNGGLGWIVAVILCNSACALGQAAMPQGNEPIVFNTNFEGGSLGSVERLADTAFRIHVQGQQDEHGQNRQASWFYFRMEHVQGREVTLTLTDLVGEYDGKPGAVPAGPDILPVVSEDGGRTWRHVPSGSWDDQKKEMTIRITPGVDAVLVAHVPPYTPSNLDGLLGELGQSPRAVAEMIGQTAGGKALHLVTITDPQVPDAQKSHLWIMARQHAWESGTSYVAEGAMRFLVSDDPQAQELRRQAVFSIIPMVDVDGSGAGKVRFNANGYDVNRHWDEVDLRHGDFLKRMPEIWYCKKAILAAQRERGGHGIDLLVNLHNTETNEYLETNAQDASSLERIRRFARLLGDQSTFDPSHDLSVRTGHASTTNALSAEAGVPVVLMEQRIGPGKKLGHRPTVEDRLAFGRELVIAMARAMR